MPFSSVASLEECFIRNDDHSYEFAAVPRDKAAYSDLTGINLLATLDGGPEEPGAIRGILGRVSLSTGVVFLNVDPERIAAKATNDDVVELLRCGIRFDGKDFFVSV